MESDLKTNFSEENKDTASVTSGLVNARVGSHNGLPTYVNNGDFFCDAESRALKKIMDDVALRLAKIKLAEDPRLLTDNPRFLSAYERVSRGHNSGDDTVSTQKWRKSDYPWCHLTVNPPPESSSDTAAARLLKQCVDRFLARKPFEGLPYYYTIEIRGRSPLGIHAHILVNRKNVDCSAFRKYVSSTFATVTSNPSSFTYRYLADGGAHYLNCIKYICGIKVPREKQEGVQLSHLWRSSIGFEDYYTNQGAGAADDLFEDGDSSSSQGDSERDT